MPDEQPYESPRGLEPTQPQASAVWLILAIAAALMSLPVAGFCLFGFLATYEATDGSGAFVVFRVVYGAVGLGCPLATLALFAWALRGSPK